jgi:hypothetical protein
LNILAIFQTQNGTDAIIIMISIPTFFAVHIYSIFFLVFEPKIIEFLKDLQKIGDNDALTKMFMNEAYSTASKHNLFVIIFLLIPGVSLASFFPLITGKTTLIFWQPNSLISDENIFIYMFFYQLLIFLQTGIIFVIFLELFIHPIVIINGYSKYCEHQLSKLSCNVKLERTTIKNCVEVHQNLIALKNQYNAILAAPLLFQAFLSAYTNCALIYLLSIKVRFL